MLDESTITIDLQQLNDVIEQIETITVELPEEERNNLELIQENLVEINQLLQPVELTEDELLEIDTLKQEELEFNNSIESNLIDLNNNIIHLTEVIEQDINTYNELDELEIRSNWANIILLLVFVFFIFSKGVLAIFNFFGNKIF